MNKYTFRPISILLGLMLAMGACAKQRAPTTSAEAIDSAIANPQSLSSDDAEFNKSMIEVDQDVTIDAFVDMKGRPQKFNLKKGDTFNILKIEKDAQGNDYAQIVVDDEAQSKDLETPIFVSVNQLKSLNLSLLEAQDPLDANGNDMNDEDDITANDDESLTDEQIITMTKKKKKKSKMTYCYRYVKMRLIQMGLVKTKLPGVSAYMAAKELPKHGFVKTGRTQKNAKLNDVCVYRGGKGGNGHIEIRVKGGWWYGYGTKKNPINLRTHPFLGCFHKGK